MNVREPRTGSLARWLPSLQWVGSYDRRWLRFDSIAGLTAAAVVVPQAMAYGSIAGLPLVVGLYTALVPLIVYAVMGISRPLSVTTTSTIAILTAHAVQEVAPGGFVDRGNRSADMFGGRHPPGRVVIAAGHRCQFHF